MATAPKLSDILKPVDDYYNKTSTKNLKAGTQSAIVGTVTGIPDLGVAGYNWATGSNVKDLRTRVLETAGIPTKGTEGYELIYNAPDIALTVFSIGSLIKSGTKALKGLIQDRRFAKWAATNGIDTKDMGAIRKFALTGQGSDNPIVQKAIDELKKAPQFSEYFAKLDKAAVDESLKSMAPKASKITESQAARSSVEAVTKQAEGYLEKVKQAGKTQFDKARGYIGDRKVVNPDNLTKSLDDLRKIYRNKPTEEGTAVIKFLDSLEEKLRPTINVAPIAGTTVTRAGEAPRTIPGRRGYQTTTNGMVRDASGMLRPASGQPINIPSIAGVTIPGTPDTLRNIPGRAGFFTKASTQPLDLNVTEAWLKEWGQKIGIDNKAIPGATSDTATKVYKQLFGSLSDDIRASAAAANKAGDLDTQRGLGFAMQGRRDIKAAHDVYGDFVAQGLPSILKGKAANAVPFEDLFLAYKGLNPEQRALFRTHIGNTEPEALKALDSKIYNDFIAAATKELDDGSWGIDPAVLARQWKELSKDKNTVDSLVQALGTNADEFGKRMDDLYTFTRRVQAAKPTEAGNIVGAVKGDAARLAGTLGGYGLHQGVALGLDVSDKMIKTGIKPETLFKMLLTPEGKDFLKASNLSKGGQEFLQSMEKLDKARLVLPVLGLSSGATRVTRQDQEPVMPEGMENITMPEGLESVTDDAVMPEGRESIVMPDGLEVIGYPTEESTRGAANDIDTSGFVPPSMQDIQQSNPNVSMQALERRLQLGVR
jgi:hypothetical protein